MDADKFVVVFTGFSSSVYGIFDTLDAAYAWMLEDFKSVLDDAREVGIVYPEDDITKDFLSCSIKEYGEWRVSKVMPVKVSTREEEYANNRE